MTRLQQRIVALLTSEWQETRPDRDVDVPQPTVLRHKEDLKERLRTNDVVYVEPGGSPEATPQGFEWTHEQIDERVTIQAISTDRREDGLSQSGYHRVFGDYESLQPVDSSAGLAGEVRTLLLENRKQLVEFDNIEPAPARDRSEVEGNGYYRADIEVAGIQHAREIASEGR